MFVAHPSFSLSDHRKYHGRISGAVLARNMPPIFSNSFLADDEKEENAERERKRICRAKLITALSLVCSAHQERVALDQLVEMRGEPEMHLDLIAAVLRLADALHIDTSRTQKDWYWFFEEIYGKPGDPSVFEWNVNMCTKRVPIRVEDRSFPFEVQVDSGLSDNIREYRRELAIRWGIPEPVVGRLIEAVFPDLIRNFEISISNYIVHYIADHCLTLSDVSSPSPLLKEFREEILAWSLVIEQINDKEGNRVTLRDPTLGEASEDRKAARRQLNDERVYWIPSANTDPTIESHLGNIRRLLQEKSRDPKSEVFLFLRDKERGGLTMWIGDHFYKHYYDEGKDHVRQHYSRSEFLRAMESVTIPMKCGIVGYDAWMGRSEAVRNEYFDPRPSYGHLDRALELDNIYVHPFCIDGSFIGVMLFNLRDQDKFDAWTEAADPLSEIFDSPVQTELSDMLRRHEAR
jgi:hypothetical protein